MVNNFEKNIGQFIKVAANIGKDLEDAVGSLDDEQKKEFDKQLEKEGLTMEDIKAKLSGNGELKKAMEELSKVKTSL